ncbi:MAG: fibrobacter succinogenes major paralogous domain-containing protein [Bacteroidota bacterium]
MKKVFWILFVFSIFLISACKPKEERMMVSTGEVTNIGTNTADAGGQILDLGEGITQHGHYWATTPNVSASDSKTTLGAPAGTGGFTSQLEDLAAGTLYYIKAYASNGPETVFGAEISFTTVAASVPTLTTTAIGSITATTATSGGTISSEGGAPVTAKGVCWSTASGPTIANSITSDGTGSGIFTSSITGLTRGTLYYVRAFATNSAGTGYGNELSFTSGYLPPTLTTSEITDITSTFATGGGNISDDGGAAVTVSGVCWSTVTGPTTSDNITTDGTGTGTFTSTLTGLDPGLTYYVRAYATNSAGTTYGNEVTFNTDAVLPSLTTAAVSEITTTTAKSGGNITDDGGADVTARGVCWSSTSGSTTADEITTDDSGTGSFTSDLTNLTPGETYYVRAYAENSMGTAYGNEVTFTTDPELPTLTTTDASLITLNSATVGGEITDDGGAVITAQGVCWSISSDPTTDDNTVSGETGTEIFSCNITGLTSNTTYYVRAYATNSAGTAYGNQVSFNTDVVPPTVTTSEASDITATSATTGGNVTSEGDASVTAKGVCWNTAGNPTTDNNPSNDGSGSGAFTSSLTGLIHGETYYVRAYATSSGGTSYGNEISFTTLVEFPTLNSYSISSITTTTASGGGNITDDGGADVTARGVCWSTSENPTIDDDVTENGTGTGVFISSMIDLTPGTTYYVRAYATNSAGTGYSDGQTFTTDPVTITDNDGNECNVVRIGTQLWMVENLNVTKYSNGDNITNITTKATWANLTDGAYCEYDNLSENGAVYGKLYNSYASMDSRNVCPTGWHVPTSSEWLTLFSYLGGNSVAAGLLKETGTTHWNSPNEGATNESGFTALPGGYRHANGDFNYLGIQGYWSCIVDGLYSGYMTIIYNSTNVVWGYMDENQGLSVRCIKD